MYTVHACICAFFKHRYSTTNETIIIVTVIKQCIKPTECEIAIGNNKTLCVCVCAIYHKDIYVYISIRPQTIFVLQQS